MPKTKAAGGQSFWTLVIAAVIGAIAGFLTNQPAFKDALPGLVLLPIMAILGAAEAIVLVTLDGGPRTVALIAVAFVALGIASFAGATVKACELSTDPEGMARCGIARAGEGLQKAYGPAPEIGFAAGFLGTLVFAIYVGTKE